MKLKAEPKALRAAIDRLPATQHAPRDRRSGLQAFQERLLQIPVEQLGKFRMRDKALNALPVLTVDRDNAALHLRVYTLALHYTPTMQWNTISRLVPWFYEQSDYRAALGERCRRRPPPPTAAPLLARFWQQATDPMDPVAALLEAAWAEQPVLTRVLGVLRVSPGTPLGHDILHLAATTMEWHTLETQPYTETLRWIEASGGPWDIRELMLKRLLNRFFPTSPEQMTGPVAELYAMARERLHGLPEHSPGSWRGVRPEARRAAAWLDSP